MQTTMGPVDIEIFDEIVEDQKITRGKVTTLGVGEHAIFKAHQWDEKDRRFREYDTLTECRYTEGDDVINVEGISARMIEEVGVDPSNAVVRWRIDLKGCQSCS